MRLDARASGILGFAAIATWTVLYLVAVALTPTYTITGSYLSDLGNPNAPAPWAFNAADILGGILFTPFGFVVGRTVGGRAGRAAQVLLPTSAVGLVFVGIFREGSPYGLHTIVSAVFFLLLAVSAGVVGVPMYVSTTFRRVGGYLAAITVAAAIAFLITTNQLLEHVVVYAALVWQAWTAWRIYGSAPPTT
ncbi:MAG TPA: DUF998 domain-containing protein [Thermoplasmata archaeon]|nr:DUF998 domain-containing protein [Thermoplasmata archaeon]